jgi:hypothetical protein
LTQNIKSAEKSKKYIEYMVALIIVSALLSVNADPVSAMITAGVCGGFFAAVCINKLRAWTIIPMVVIPPCAVYALTGGWINVYLSLAFVPVGVAVYMGMRKRYSRGQTLTRSVFGMSVFFAIAYCMFIYKLFGAVNVGNILRYVELNLDFIRQNLEMVKEVYAKTGVDVEKIFTAEMFDGLIDSVRVSWLGYGFALFGISSFVATSIAKSSVVAKYEFKKANGSWSFVFSKVGAVVFILAYIAGSLYSAENEGLYFSLAINGICIGLYPAVLYMGASKALSKLRPQNRVLFIVLFFVSMSFGNFALLLLLIIGLYSTLTRKDNEVFKL